MINSYCDQRMEIYVKSNQESMKKLLLLLTICLCFTTCSIPKKPELSHIGYISVKHVDIQEITVTADAIFNNPNNLQGTLSIEDLHIFVDNVDVGTISSQKFDVPAKAEFTIPLEGSFSPSKIYKNNKNNILGNILKIIQTDSLAIQYKGIIRYHLGDFSYPYKIDKLQKVRLK